MKRTGFSCRWCTDLGQRRGVEIGSFCCYYYTLGYCYCLRRPENYLEIKMKVVGGREREGQRKKQFRKSLCSYSHISLK